MAQAGTPVFDIPPVWYKTTTFNNRLQLLVKLRLNKIIVFWNAFQEVGNTPIVCKTLSETLGSAVVNGFDLSKMVCQI